MRTRQTVPSQWLLIRGPADVAALPGPATLPHGSGLLVIGQLAAGELRRLRSLARSRGLVLAHEPRSAVRVHDMAELRRALLRQTPLILLSPLFPTASHPDWSPMPHMRAAAMARLGERRLIALGGMNERRYARVARLGFSGWAGISAFRT